MKNIDGVDTIKIYRLECHNYKSGLTEILLHFRSKKKAKECAKMIAKSKILMSRDKLELEETKAGHTHIICEGEPKYHISICKNYMELD